MCPSRDPEKTTSGRAVTACDCAGLQLGRSPQLCGGGALQTFSPVLTFSANSPPPWSEFSNRRYPCAVVLSATTPLNPRSDSATYIFCPSVAEPHIIPPSGPPFPMRVCQRIAPSLSGSSAYAIPDF